MLRCEDHVFLSWFTLSFGVSASFYFCWVITKASVNATKIKSWLEERPKLDKKDRKLLLPLKGLVNEKNLHF